MRTAAVQEFDCARAIVRRSNSRCPDPDELGRKYEIVLELPNALPCAGPARSPDRPRHNSRSDQSYRGLFGMDEIKREFQRLLRNSSHPDLLLAAISFVAAWFIVEL